MKLSTYASIAGLFGLAIMMGLIVHEGYQTILETLGHAGWGLLWIIPFHALPLILDAESWRVLLRPRDPAGYATRPFLVWIATVREAVSRLLPVASIGGELVGIRLAMQRPLDGAAITASVILEVLLTLINQYLFTAIGLVLLITTIRHTQIIDTLLWGTAVSLPVPIMLALLLRYGSPFSHIARFTERMLGSRHRLNSLLGNAPTLDEEIRGLYRRHRLLWAALAWQLAGMLVGSFETWLALELFGHPTTIWNAVILESMWLTIRHLAFFVPGALGVQEGGLLLIGSLIGLPADAAIALSLAKRMREIAIGLPALASWQWVEVRRIHRLAGTAG
ncbi:MAG: lysylphosphatidylglycerol synthase domain-containing protein [Nitrospirales bacterium]